MQILGGETMESRPIKRLDQGRGGYNACMPEITPLLPQQAAEARHLIYRVAHTQFPHGATVEESIRVYEDSWPLRDVQDFQHAYLENGGVFLVLRDGGRIIGTGALRYLEEGVGEIKRLWLLPEYQGQGLGYQMMQALFAAAREKGYHTLRLETSPAFQARAYEFYKRLGFREIPRYGDDPHDVGFELALTS
jgi:putative acetyltransferase